MALDDQPFLQQLWGAKYPPKTVAGMLLFTLVLSQILAGLLSLAEGYRGPKLVEQLFGHTLSFGWVCTIMLSGLGFLARRDGRMSRRRRSGAAAANSLVLPSLIGTEYLASTQLPYFQPPEPSLRAEAFLSLVPFMCFGIIWLCDVIRQSNRSRNS